MPFFQRPLSKAFLNKRLVTLQVRIPLKICGQPGKRALSSTSIIRRDRASGQRLAGSLTVEAALALPLFLFAMMILMMPMRLMNENRKIQAELEAVCAELSQYAGLLYETPPAGSDYEESVLPPELAANMTKAGMRLYAEGKIRSRIDTGKAGQMSLSDSEILEDGETIDLILHYQMYLPFPVFRMKGVPMTVRSCRRAWIGRAGGNGKENTGQDASDELVYIGKSSTRYHRNRECHYIYNDITVTPFDTVTEIRNSEGKKYRPCARCGDFARPGGSVYIMPGGESYHSDRSCSSISAYVRAVPLSEVEYLGPCSYCAWGRSSVY